MLSFKPTFSFRLLPKFSSFGCRTEVPVSFLAVGQRTLSAPPRALRCFPSQPLQMTKTPTSYFALKGLVRLHQASHTPNNLCLHIRQRTKKVMYCNRFTLHSMRKGVSEAEGHPQESVSHSTSQLPLFLPSLPSIPHHSTN